MMGKGLYTKWCRKCKNYFQTESKCSKVCPNCDGRQRKNRVITK